jgi:hypothetical protein
MHCTVVVRFMVMLYTNHVVVFMIIIAVPQRRSRIIIIKKKKKCTGSFTEHLRSGMGYRGGAGGGRVDDGKGRRNKIKKKIRKGMEKRRGNVRRRRSKNTVLLFECQKCM